MLLVDDVCEALDELVRSERAEEIDKLDDITGLEMGRLLEELTGVVVDEVVVIVVVVKSATEVEDGNGVTPNDDSTPCEVEVAGVVELPTPAELEATADDSIGVGYAHVSDGAVGDVGIEGAEDSTEAVDVPWVM